MINTCLETSRISKLINFEVPLYVTNFNDV